MARWAHGALLVLMSTVAGAGACKRATDDAGDERPEKKVAQEPAAAAGEEPEPESESESESESPAPAESTGPRYLRKNRKGQWVDAFRFPSVPAFIVEKEVGAASSRSDVAKVLKRFGMAPLKGDTGEVWIAKASLVDGLGRERILVASFRGEASADGLRSENDWIVFLGSTKDDRILKIDAARIETKARDGAPVEVDARELHAGGFADVVATWSSCAEGQKGCHHLRAWTMQRGRPEQILDVAGDAAPEIGGGSAPHDVTVDGRVLRFDAQSFAYR